MYRAAIVVGVVRATICVYIYICIRCKSCTVTDALFDCNN